MSRGYILKFRFRKSEVDLRMYAQVFQYSIFIMINLLINQMNWKIDTLLLSKVISPLMDKSLMITVATNAQLFSTVFSSMSIAISGFLLPKATEMIVNKSSNAKITNLMIRVGRVQAMFLALFLICFGTLGHSFVVLWVGKEYKDILIVALIYMSSMFIPYIQHTGVVFLRAMNKHASRSIALLVSSLLHVALSVLLIPKYGVIGASIGTAFSFLIGDTVCVNVIYKKQGIEIRRFFRDTFAKLYIPILITILISLMTCLLPTNGWIMLVSKALVICCVYVVLLYFNGLNEEERMYLWRVVRRTLPNNSV
ncbi:hypothetical protein AGMMS49992_27330 [Clostridia bacterium]|nr:hypothetical protein AGMMS49992_27330 [Clostridia bacterium]